MKKINLIIPIFILFNTFYFLNAQKVEKIKLKIPGRPWHVSYVPETGNLTYYFHSTGKIEEDVTTDIYTISVSGKTIKKETKNLTYKETKEKYPWYFYEGKKIVKEDYHMVWLLNYFVFEKYNWKEFFHSNQLFYERV